MESLNSRKLTWAALLTRWIQFARSAVALPDNVEGQAWRNSISDIIGLQALCMALNETHELDPNERALGLDRAQILLERHIHALQKAFGTTNLHPMLMELIADAHKAIDYAAEINDRQT